METRAQAVRLAPSRCPASRYGIDSDLGPSERLSARRHRRRTIRLFPRRIWGPRCNHFRNFSCSATPAILKNLNWRAVRQDLAPGRLWLPGAVCNCTTHALVWAQDGATSASASLLRHVILHLTLRTSSISLRFAPQHPAQPWGNRRHLRFGICHLPFLQGLSES